MSFPMHRQNGYLIRDSAFTHVLASLTDYSTTILPLKILGPLNSMKYNPLLRSLSSPMLRMLKQFSTSDLMGAGN